MSVLLAKFSQSYKINSYLGIHMDRWQFSAAMCLWKNSAIKNKILFLFFRCSVGHITRGRFSCQGLLWFPEWCTAWPPEKGLNKERHPRSKGAAVLMQAAAEAGEHPATDSASRFSNHEARNWGWRKRHSMLAKGSTLETFSSMFDLATSMLFLISLHLRE